MIKELPQRATSLHIRRVILWDTSQVLVIDSDGKQIPELQGHFDTVGRRIHDVYKGMWHIGDWKTGTFRLSTFVEISQIRDRSLLFQRTYALDSEGFIRQRRLPDGRLLAVDPLLYGRARLGIGPKPPLEDAEWFADIWEYATVEAALKALEEWNPGADSEPDGWDRHPASSRYRIGGASDLEYVRGEGEPLQQARDAALSTWGVDYYTVLVEQKPLGSLSELLPLGTSCYHLVTEGKKCTHTPKCRWHLLIYHYLDRCVVEMTPDGMIDVGKLLRRLTER